jgi:hypothetical protein
MSRAAGLLIRAAFLISSEYHRTLKAPQEAVEGDAESIQRASGCCCAKVRPAGHEGRGPADYALDSLVQ